MNLAATQRPQQTQDTSTTKESVLTAPSYKVIEEAVIGALPENVRVSVVVPESYYRVVAMQSGELTAESTEDEIRAAAQKYQPEVEEALRKRVSKIIPIPTGQNANDFIDIGSYIATPHQEQTFTTPWTETLSYFFKQWGSAIALSIFALWAFWMLNKTVRSQTPPEIPEEDPLAKSKVTEEDEEEEYDDLTPQGDTKRVDHLQTLVRKNPDMTASIISSWIQEAK